MVFRSVPIIILSFANSNCAAVTFSAPSTAALMAATFTKFARSSSRRYNNRKSHSETNHKQVPLSLLACPIEKP